MNPLGQEPGADEELELGQEEWVQGEEALDEEVRAKDHPGRLEAKPLPDPGAPTERERVQHSLTHLPFRSWCPICTSSKGYGHPHRASEDISDIPITGMGYSYMGEQEEPGCAACLAITDQRSKAIVAIVVPRKGRDPYVEDRRVQAFNFMGYKRALVRSDQEPALCALIDDLKGSWSGEPMHERAPRGDHKANGSIESGVRTVGAQIRGLKIALEERYNITLDHTSTIIPWIVEYAGWLVTRFGIGREGRTPYRILRGRDMHTPLCELGECIQFRPVGITRARGKLQAMLMEGVYLDKTHSSGESIVGTPEGIFKARDIYRKAIDLRFDVEVLKKINATPWNKHPERDVDVPEFEVKEPGERMNTAEVDQIGDPLPRRVELTKEIMEKLGYSTQCPGCVNLRLGKYHRPHLESCRRRIGDQIKADAVLKHRIEAAAARQDAWEDREIQRIFGDPIDPAETQPAQEAGPADNVVVTTPPTSPRGEGTSIPNTHRRGDASNFDHDASILNIPRRGDASVFNNDMVDVDADDAAISSVRTISMKPGIDRSRKRTHQEIDEGLEDEVGVRGDTYSVCRYWSFELIVACRAHALIRTSGDISCIRRRQAAIDR